MSQLSVYVKLQFSNVCGWILLRQNDRAIGNALQGVVMLLSLFEPTLALK